MSSTTRRFMSSTSSNQSNASNNKEDKKKKKKGNNSNKKKKNDKRTTTKTKLEANNNQEEAQEKEELSAAELEAIKIAAKMEEDTLSWVERVVVGMNLCPFAAKPLINQQLYIVVVRGDDLNDIMRTVLAQAQVFAATQQQDDKDTAPHPGTALVVCPELFPNDFGEFLNVVNVIVDGLFEDYQLNGKVQVVPFHPQFIFAGDDDGDGDADAEQEEEEHNKEEEEMDREDGGSSSTQENGNAGTTTRKNNDDNNNQQDNNKMEYWTNRSPYPMFHILKEDDVSRAVQIMKGDTDRVWQRNVQLLQYLENNTTPTSRGGDGDDNDEQRSKLETYLLTGKDDEGDSIQTLIQQALVATAREFPMLEKPISDDNSNDDKTDNNKDTVGKDNR